MKSSIPPELRMTGLTLILLAITGLAIYLRLVFGAEPILWLGGGLAGLGWLLAAVISASHAFALSEKTVDRFALLALFLSVCMSLMLFWGLSLETAPGGTAPAAVAEANSPNAPPSNAIQNSNSALMKLGLNLSWAFAYLGIGLFVLTQLARLCLALKRPRDYQKRESQIFDVASDLGFPPQGNGPYEKLFSVYGNQAFTYERNLKRFRLDRLPRAFHGLRLLHFSDLHFTGELTLDFYQHLVAKIDELKPEIILFTGDLLDNPQLIDWLPETFGKLQAPLGCYYILGNHDWLQNTPQIRAALNQLGWQECSHTPIAVEKDGAKLWLAGDERPWMGEAPQWGNVPQNHFRILLSHTPDNIFSARKAGVDLMLSGHNHGGQFCLPLIGPFLAPSRFHTLFAGGEFSLSPTTLHVSRGVSGRHPLRLNCRAEVTLLELISSSVNSTAQTSLDETSSA